MQQGEPSTSDDARNDTGTPMDAAATLAELSETSAPATNKDGTKEQDNGGSDYDSDIDISKKCENGFTETFPQRLREVIETEGADKSIIWSSDGLSFMITSPRIFVSSILPQYFKQTKFASFTRKLNRWGFKRITKGPNAGAYFHKLFQRDKPELCIKMLCQKVKAPRKKKPSAQQASKSDMGLPGASLPGSLSTGLLPGTSSDMMDALIRERAVAALSADQRLQTLQLQALRGQVDPSSGGGMMMNPSLSSAMPPSSHAQMNLLESAALRRSQMLLEANRMQLGLMHPSPVGLGGFGEASLLGTMERLYQQDLERLQGGPNNRLVGSLASDAKNSPRDAKQNASTKPTALGNQIKRPVSEHARGA